MKKLLLLLLIISCTAPAKQEISYTFGDCVRAHGGVITDEVMAKCPCTK